jgi:mannose-1-phosphate guanylyltransferase
MRIVLLSGGAGKRLWPMSNDSRSKQFLKVLRSHEGTPVSMLQRVWSQLKQAGLHRQAHICAAKAQYEMIEQQLGAVSIIEEPSRRDTFPAIALAAAYLKDIEGCGDDEVMVVMPVDPFVDEGFYTILTRLPAVLEQSRADIALMGVCPTEATSKFGYIETQSARIQRIVEAKSATTDWPCTGTQVEDSWVPVRAFIEKPAQSLATQLISNGALWNCGVFAFRVGYLIQELQRLGHPTDHKSLRQSYDTLPKRSFDYEVVERAANIVAIPYAGAWCDLGTWGSLSKQMTESFVGRGVSVNCDNTHAVNELGIPLVAMGLRNVMVVSTPDGILVADKEHAANIKDVTQSFSGHPMVEERHWGSSRVLDYQKLVDDSEVLTKCIDILPGRHISYQRHRRRTEVWTVIEGYGQLVLGTRVIEVTPGDVVKIYPDMWHAVLALTGLQIIEVQRGEALGEDDIERRFESWEHIVNHCETIPV